MYDTSFKFCSMNVILTCRQTILWVYGYFCGSGDGIGSFQMNLNLFKQTLNADNSVEPEVK